MKAIRVTLYARVSTSDKDQDPETQLLPLREFAQAQNWQTVGEFVDHASATDLRGRTAWRDLLALAARRKIDLIVVWKLDRAFRSVKWFGGFKTRREAEQFRLTLATNPAFSAGSGPYGSPRLRLRDYLPAWLDARRTLGKLRPRTAIRYEELIRLHVVPALGHISLIRLAPPAVQHLYVSLILVDLAPATVCQVGRILHVALGDAMKRGLISRNPCDSVSLPKVERFEPVIWTPKQVAAYLDDALATALPSLYALYAVSMGCGTRLGETLAIRESDVDFDRHVLHVGQTLVHSGREPQFGPPKTAKGRRDILMPEEAVVAVRNALHWKKAQRLRVGPRFRDFGLIICSDNGTPLNPSNVRNRDHLPRLGRLDLPHTRIHDMRHMHGSYLSARNVDARAGSDRLGHSDPAFFMRTYTHPLEETQAQAAAVAKRSPIKVNGSCGGPKHLKLPLVQAVFEIPVVQVALQHDKDDR